MVNSPRRCAISTQPHEFTYLDFGISYVHDEKIAELYVQGNSLSDIVKVVGVCKSKVKAALLRTNTPIRKPVLGNYKASQFQLGKKSVKPPYGFVYFEGKVVKHPKEYPHLLQIINLWKKGMALNSIAKKMNEQKVPSPLGKKWSFNSIDNIIKRIKNGHLVQNGDNYELR